jgi:hypothetical protein
MPARRAETRRGLHRGGTRGALDHPVSVRQISRQTDVVSHRPE